MPRELIIPSPGETEIREYQEPELKPELISLFEAQKDTESAGVYARAKILLQKLYKEIS